MFRTMLVVMLPTNVIYLQEEVTFSLLCVFSGLRLKGITKNTNKVYLKSRILNRRPSTFFQRSAECGV